MTPERRAEIILNAAELEFDSHRGGKMVTIESCIRRAAAEQIRAAVEEAEREQRARIVAFFEADLQTLRTVEGHVDEARLLANAIRAIKEGEPEAWAARTGWEP